MKSLLRIEDLILQVKLGCGADERAERQEVRVSVELRFEQPLKACQTDELSDTVCYADLCDGLKQLVENQEFHLIEKLALDAYRVIQKIASPFPAQIGVQIHKVNPPVRDLQGGSIFCIQDF